MVIEAFWPSCSGSLPDLWTVQPILQGWMAADWVEVPMTADGTLIWPFLGEILAHDGLRGWPAASPHPRGGGVSQRTAQPMVVTPKSFPDAPRFWTLPLLGGCELWVLNMKDAVRKKLPVQEKVSNGIKIHDKTHSIACLKRNPSPRWESFTVTKEERTAGNRS